MPDRRYHTLTTMRRVSPLGYHAHLVWMMAYKDHSLIISIYFEIITINHVHIKHQIPS